MWRRMVGDIRIRREGQGRFLSPFLVFNLACGGTHRLQARWQSWLACFVQKQQRPRQCRIRPYRNPHSLKPGPHPHSLQQSDTQPQPTALDTPGRGSRAGSRSTCKQPTAFVWSCAPPKQAFDETMTPPATADSDRLQVFAVLSCKRCSTGAARWSQLMPNIICMYYLSQIWGGRGRRVRGEGRGVCVEGGWRWASVGWWQKQRMV